MSPVSSVFAVLALLGCAPTSGTEAGGPGRALARSAERLPTIKVTLRADRTVATPGEIVEFTATATNRGTARVQIGEQCGPPMDVAIAPPAGKERSALADQLFACPLLAEHFVGPGQTQTLRLSWLVPATRGTYTAVAGLRRGDGLGNLSTPVQLVVR